MSKNKKSVEEKPLRCIVYVSTEGDIRKVAVREKKQLRSIMEYANAHNITVTEVMYRDIVGQVGVNKHLYRMINMITEKKADGILVSNMLAISDSIPDAYTKIAVVSEAGGVMVTADEGRYKPFYIRRGAHDEKQNM